MPDIFTAPSSESEQQPEKPETGRRDQPLRTPQPEEQRLSNSLPPATQASSPGLFTSYRPYPLGVTFINQEENEQILLFLRRHFVTNLPWIFYTIVFLLFPPFVFGVLHVTNVTFFSLTPQMIFVMVAFYYLVILNYALVRFINWFYHVGVVTRKRLLDLDVDNILSYHLAETNIADVVDVSYTQKGFFQSFFNYGDVPIQTEAIKANFEFEQTPHPANVADILTDLRPELKGKHHYGT